MAYIGIAGMSQYAREREGGGRWREREGGREGGDLLF